ncbi:tail fiber domain-containing protein, partial [bacterium]|nr:tail fiber domain-containing protein [bacterium]
RGRVGVIDSTGAMTVSSLNNAPLSLVANGTGAMTFTTNSSTEAARFDSSGRLGVGVVSPSARVDIADTTLAGSGSLAGSALSVAQTWNTTGTPTAVQVSVTNTASNSSSLLQDYLVGGSSLSSLRVDGRWRSQGFAVGANYPLNNNYGFDVNNGMSAMSGGGYLDRRAYSASSGTTTYNSFETTATINQTGTATGVTRGLYVNPTLTAAADYRAIEATNGRVLLTDTTNTGSNANPSLLLSPTWNTSGTPTAFRVNVTDTASNASSLLVDLQVGGASRFNVTKSGNVVSAGTVTASGVTLTSDERLKTDIHPIENALDRILKIDGVRYRWKDPKTMDGKAQIGVIAQKVEKVFPEAVST